MKIIAVSQRMDALPDRQETRDALDQRLVELLGACDCLAVPVPNTLASSDRLARWVDVVRPAGFVLSGGNDIGSAPARDQTERALLSHAAAASLPVLGICRGMQMMGVLGRSNVKSR